MKKRECIDESYALSFLLNQVCHCFVDAAVPERIQVDLCRCDIGMTERLGYQRDIDTRMSQYRSIRVPGYIRRERNMQTEFLT